MAGTVLFSTTLGQFNEGAWTGLLLFLFLIALTGEVALIATRGPGAPHGMLANRNLLHYRPQPSQCPCAKPSEAGCVTGAGRAELGDLHLARCSGHAKSHRS
jgi:hypothetical protein